MSSSPYILPEHSHVSAELRHSVERDYQRFAEQGPPESLDSYIAETYGIDLSAEYAGLPLKNPWGKASGQLSMTARQVADDVQAGLGFVVLKTVIAQDETGGQSMREWAIPESRMVAEPITGQSGERGWTISWKGRGWWQTFDEYLQLIRDAQAVANGSGTLIVPSCKYHLPTPDESDWRVSEYRYTTPRLLEAWRSAAADPSIPMPLEKDFSPTLAGSDRSAQRAKILEWLRMVPQLVYDAATQTDAEDVGPETQADSPAAGTEIQADGSAVGPTPKASAWAPRPTSGPLRLGLKVFNALFDDEFQLEMLRTIHRPGRGRPDFFVYANRLFDPHREFDGHRGIAYGGPDLSDRNLRVMTRFQSELASTGGWGRSEAEPPAGRAGRSPDSSTPATRSPQPTGTYPKADASGPPSLLPWSATGNIGTGKMALEYALRGAGSFQLHTYFQLPADQYRMKTGSKVQKALHELYLHPKTGFVVWMHHLARQWDLGQHPVRFRDVVGQAPQSRIMHQSSQDHAKFV